MADATSTFGVKMVPDSSGRQQIEADFAAVKRSATETATAVEAGASKTATALKSTASGATTAGATFRAAHSGIASAATGSAAAVTGAAGGFERLAGSFSRSSNASLVLLRGLGPIGGTIAEMTHRAEALDTVLSATTAAQMAATGAYEAGAIAAATLEAAEARLIAIEERRAGILASQAAAQRAASAANEEASIASIALASTRNEKRSASLAGADTSSLDREVVAAQRDLTAAQIVAKDAAATLKAESGALAAVELELAADQKVAATAAKDLAASEALAASATEGATSGIAAQLARFGPLIATIGLLAGAFIALKSAIGDASEYQQALLKLETISGDAKQATTELAKLEQLARKSPFNVAELAQAERVIASITGGLKSEAVSMETVAAVAFGTGKGLDQVATSIARLHADIVNGGPSVSREILLLERTGVVSGDVATHVRNMVKEHKSSSDTIAYLDEKLAHYSGTLEAYESTLTGVKGSIGADIKNAFANFGAPLLNNITPALAFVDQRLNGIATNFAGQLGTGLSHSITGLQEVGAAFGPILAAAGKTLLDTLIYGLGSTGAVIGTLITGLLSAAASFLQTLASGLEKAVGAFNGLLVYGVTAATNKIPGTTKDTRDLSTTVNDNIAEVSGTLSGLIKVAADSSADLFNRVGTNTADLVKQSGETLGQDIKLTLGAIKSAPANAFGVYGAANNGAITPPASVFKSQGEVNAPKAAAGGGGNPYRDYDKIKTDAKEIGEYWYQLSLIEAQVTSETEKNAREMDLAERTAKKLYDPGVFTPYTAGLNAVNKKLLDQVGIHEARARAAKLADKQIEAGTATLETTVTRGLQKVSDSIGTWQTQVVKAIGDVSSALSNDISGGLSDILDGTKSVAQGFADMAVAVLKDIQSIILKLLIELAIQQLLGAFGYTTTGGGGGGYTRVAKATPVYHDGGVVGQGSPSTRFVDAAMFLNAPRFHNGLAPDEMPAILQRGETVIPRGQSSGSQAGGNTVNITTIYKDGNKSDQTTTGGNDANTRRLAATLTKVMDDHLLNQRRHNGLVARR